VGGGVVVTFSLKKGPVCGQRKRIRLFVNLLRLKPVLLLDEVPPSPPHVSPAVVTPPLQDRWYSPAASQDLGLEIGIGDEAKCSDLTTSSENRVFFYFSTCIS